MDKAEHRLGIVSKHVTPDAEAPNGKATAEKREQYIAQNHHSVFLPEDLKSNEPFNVVRSALSPEKLISRFPASDDEICTLYDILQNSAKRFAKARYLGTRRKRSDGGFSPYMWIPYGKAASIRTEIGSGLLQLGLKPHSTVGIFSINCEEWVLLDAACHAYSMTTVPLYDTLGPDTTTFICNHAEAEAVGCSAATVRTMLDALSKCPTIKVVLVWDLEDDMLPAAPLDSTFQILSLRQVAALGAQNLKPHVPPKPEDLAIICYTSGTTGVPKGAKLTHRGLIANAAGNVALIPDLVPGHRHLSYLPLAHIYERINLTVATYLGTEYGFYHGDIVAILDDVQELRPTLFSSVPRLFNRIYDKVSTLLTEVLEWSDSLQVMGGIKASNVITQQLFAAGYASKKAALEKGDMSQAPWGFLYDRLIFSKLKERLGGKVEYLITGASPISAEVFDFLRICFGARVVEGYGMTETSCTICLTNFADMSSGHVGSPIPCCEVKLVDIPEMSYLTSDQPHPRCLIGCIADAEYKGEVCVRGPLLFAGYHKDDALTAEVIDSAGWFHTGDVGCWLPKGRLKIIDRRKNLFKLAQGEYVAPEKIENIYARCPLVAQVFVYGDSLKHQLVGIVVPDTEVLFAWAKHQGIKKTLPALCEDRDVLAAVLDGMQSEGRIAGLAGFEQVQAICLVPEAFTVENDLLTPTFKLKRHQAKQRFQAQIDALYLSLAS